MGTRADFYIGKDESAEWIGSIAWDGYRSGIPSNILLSTSENEFRQNVLSFLKERDDASFPEEGWPWPWETSQLTDCSYWFFDNKVWDSHYGPDSYPERRYWPINIMCPMEEDFSDTRTEEERNAADKKFYETLDIVRFPETSHMKHKPIFGKHSGVMLVRV